MNDHRISRRSFLAAAGIAGAAAALTACGGAAGSEGSGCPHCLRRRCFQHSRFRGILCRRVFTSSPERGADRVCCRIPHRDPHRHR